MESIRIDRQFVDSRERVREIGMSDLCVVASLFDARHCDKANVRRREGGSFYEVATDGRTTSQCTVNAAANVNTAYSQRPVVSLASRDARFATLVDYRLFVI